MENRQLTHTEITNRVTKFPVVVVTENIETPENIGMIFRISEAMGVSEIYLTGSSLHLPNRKAEKTSRSTIRNVSYTHAESTTELFVKLRSEGYRILALEVTENATLLPDVDFNLNEKYAIVVGSEKHGIQNNTLKQTDECIAIEMFGNNTSINVVTALAISLYELTKQLSHNFYLVFR